MGLDRATVATAALSSAWITLRTAMDGAWNPSDAALDAMEALGRHADAWRQASKAFEACAAEVRDHEARAADLEEQCDRLRERMAALDDETRRGVSSLHDRSAMLGANLAARHSAFAAQAEALERHLAAFPTSSSLRPPGDVGSA